MESKLSKYLAGFPKNHSTQHALLKMIEAWRCMLNKCNKVGALVMDLSKALDTLNHNLFLCKHLYNTQTILRLLPKNCLSVSDHFVGLALKGFNDTTENVTGEMILGIVIENKLNFKFYLKMYAKRLAKKLSTLSRISN